MGHQHAYSPVQDVDGAPTIVLICEGCGHVKPAWDPGPWAAAAIVVAIALAWWFL